MNVTLTFAKSGRNVQRSHTSCYFFGGNCLCVPLCSLRDAIIFELHISNIGGHFGREKPVIAVQANFYWQHIERDVRKHYMAYSLLHCKKSW